MRDILKTILLSSLVATGYLNGQTNSPEGELIVLDPLEVLSSAPKNIDDSAMKFPALIHEIPRSVSVIDADRIREQNFQNPVDTFYYTPGVFPNSTVGGGYHYIARGFRMSPNETRIDGFEGFYVGGGQSPQSLYGVERIVSLRGPASLLYGSATMPGGLINIITKKPAENAFTRLDFTTSTYAGNGLGLGDRTTFGAELDTTGPLTSDHSFLYRVILAGDNSDHYTADVLNKTRYLNAALTYRFDPEGRTTLTTLVQYTDYSRPAGAAMVMSPSTSLSTVFPEDETGPIQTGDLTSFDINLYDGVRTDSMLVTGFDFHSKALDPLVFDVGYRYIAYQTDINQWSPVVTTPAQQMELQTNGTVSRTQAKSWADRDSHNFDIKGVYEVMPTDWWKNLLQAGLNGRFYRSESSNATGPLSTPQSPISIRTGEVTVPVNDVSTGWNPVSLDDDFYWNTYLQNQAAFMDQRWILTLGLGYGQQHYNDAPTRKGEITPNAALLYNVNRGVALYTSYATSYQPADPTLQNFAGQTNTFSPQSGVNYEAGVKFTLPNNRAMLGIAIYQTERDSVIVQDTSLGQTNPNGMPYYIEEKGQSARGIEFNGDYQITDDWVIKGTFATIDASYETGPFPDEVAKTPAYSWSLFTRYNFHDGMLKGFGSSIGVVWQDERLGGNGARNTSSNYSPLTLPAFYRVDAGFYYQVNSHVDVSLNIQNVLDEKIFVDGTTGANLQLAAPRTVSLRIGYTW